MATLNLHIAKPEARADSPCFFLWFVLVAVGKIRQKQKSISMFCARELFYNYVVTSEGCQPTTAMCYYSMRSFNVPAPDAIQTVGYASAPAHCAMKIGGHNLHCSNTYKSGRSGL